MRADDLLAFQAGFALGNRADAVELRGKRAGGVGFLEFLRPEFTDIGAVALGDIGNDLVGYLARTCCIVFQRELAHKCTDECDDDDDQHRAEDDVLDMPLYFGQEGTQERIRLDGSFDRFMIYVCWFGHMYLLAYHMA